MQAAIIAALNEQIRLEFNAAFLYLSFSAELREFGLPGMAHWMREQYREECGHALRLISYLGTRGGKVSMPHISPPSYAWETPLDIFEMALKHEKLVSASVDALLALCQERRDYATQGLMFDYVREQVEEERSVLDIVEELRFCRGSGAGEGLLRLDARLAARTLSSSDIWD